MTRRIEINGASRGTRLFANRPGVHDGAAPLGLPGTGTMDVSVIIPARNAASTIGEQLEALSTQRHDGPWEVIVVDNGSTDGTAAVAEGFRDRLPGLRVVTAADGLGVAFARNAGATVAEGELLAFCDADDVVQPGWLTAIVGAGRRCGAVGGRLDERAVNDETTVARRGERLVDGLVTHLGYLPHPLGANCAVRRDVFAELGGFAEEFVGGGDDVEFFWRVQLAGHRLCFEPNAVVSYRHRSGLRALGRQYFRFGRNDPLLYKRFRAHGVPRPTVRQAVRTWAWLLLHVHYLWRGPKPSGYWVRTAANRWGRLVGSVHHRVFVP